MIYFWSFFYCSRAFWYSSLMLEGVDSVSYITGTFLVLLFKGDPVSSFFSLYPRRLRFFYLKINGVFGGSLRSWVVSSFKSLTSYCLIFWTSPRHPAEFALFLTLYFIFLDWSSLYLFWRTSYLCAFCSLISNFWVGFYYFFYEDIVFFFFCWYFLNISIELMIFLTFDSASKLLFLIGDIPFTFLQIWASFHWVTEGHLKGGILIEDLTLTLLFLFLF